MGKVISTSLHRPACSAFAPISHALIERQQPIVFRTLGTIGWHSEVTRNVVNAKMSTPKSCFSVISVGNKESITANCTPSNRSFVTMVNLPLSNSHFRTSVTRQNPRIGQLDNQLPTSITFPFAHPFQLNVRCMNRNARRPKRANHGKRPVSHARRREKAKRIKSRAYKEKIFGFW